MLLEVGPIKVELVLTLEVLDFESVNSFELLGIGVLKFGVLEAGGVELEVAQFEVMQFEVMQFEVVQYEVTPGFHTLAVVEKTVSQKLVLHR